MKYFLRVLARNRMNYSTGEPVVCELIGNDYGLISLDETKEEDKQKLAELSKLADKHHGFEHLTVEKHAEYKKKYPLSSPSLRRTAAHKEVRLFKPDAQMLGTFAQPARDQSATVQVVEGVLPPAQPAAEPATSEPLQPFRPRVGRPPKPKHQAV